MEWLGMRSDEEVEYQTRRAPQHRSYVEQVLKSGAAYMDYCPKDRLEQFRNEAKEKHLPFVYRRSLLTEAEIEQYKATGEPGVIRLRAPETGTTGYDDLVYGRIEAPNETIGDFVIARADGSPLYNFTNAVDDIDMGITHVCRGEDHVSNTLRQVLVYEAVGARTPVFAHLPLILGTDKKRLSKRHGATSVMQFRQDGILPEALINFLALLGWAPEGNAEFDEIMSIEELTRLFSLDKVNKSGAVFDYDKLHWMNGMYIRRLPKEQVYAAVVPELDEVYGAAGGPDDEEPGRAEWLRSIIDLEIERSRTMKDFAVNLDYFFVAPETFDEKASKKLLSTPEQVQQLRDVTKEIDSAWPVDAHATRDQVAETLDAHLRAWAETRGIKFGNAVHPVRLALTGRSASPPLFDVIYNLGKIEVLSRLNRAADHFSTQELP
jgi:glutamyl-tRNA synthetase